MITVQNGNKTRRPWSLANKLLSGLNLLQRKAETNPKITLAVILGLSLILNIYNQAVKPITQDLGETWRWWPDSVSFLQSLTFRSCVPVYFPFCGPANNISASLEPLPVLLFAASAFVSQQSLWFARGVEVVLNITALLGVYLLTSAWANKRAAFLAAFIWATYLPAIKLVTQISGDLLATVFVTFGFYFFIRARSSKRRRDWIAAGITLGLGVLSRSAVLAIVAVLVIGLVIEGWKASRAGQGTIMKLIRPAVLFLLMVSILIAPWFTRNYLVFGKPVLGTTLIGYNLYRQNYMIGENNNYLRFVGPKEAALAINALVARRPDLKGTENEAQMDTVYRAEALKVIAAHPVQYGLLSAYRFLPLWFNWGIEEAYGDQPPLIWYTVMAWQAVLLVTALLGVWVTRWHSWPLPASIIVVSLSYMAIISELRYLVLVMPLVISLSVVGIQKIESSLLLKSSEG